MSLYVYGDTLTPQEVAKSGEVGAEFKAIQAAIDQLEALVQRALRVNDAIDVMSEDPAARAGKMLGFDEEGAPVAVVDIGDSGLTLPVPVEQGGTAGTTQAQAQANLGVPPVTRKVSAGTGLSGGGDLSQNRTLSLDNANSRNVDHNAVSVIAGNGLNGGGTLAQSRTLNVGAGTGITVDDNSVGINTAVVPRLNTANVYTAQQTVESTAPRYVWSETGGNADEGRWRALVEGGSWFLQTRTDGDGAGVNAIKINRSGIAVTTIEFGAPSGAKLNGDLLCTEARFPRAFFASADDPSPVNNSTAFHDDPLFIGIPLDAAGYYRFEAYLAFVVGGTAAGLKLRFVFTSAPDFSNIAPQMSMFGSSTVDGSSSGVAISSTLTYSAADGNVVVHIVGSVRANIAVGGTFKLQYSQVSAEVADLTRQKGSWVKLEKISTE